MTYGVYPNATPEFRMLEKQDGTMAMQVRYISKQMGYTGKWMDVKTEKENGNTNTSNGNASSHL